MPTARSASLSPRRPGTTSRLGWPLLALLVCVNATARAAGPPTRAIADTQLTVRQGRKQYRASVVGKRADTLTFVTAAHCISVADAATPLTIHQGDRMLAGRVVAIAQNPDYRPIAARGPNSSAVRGVLSVDTAVATIRVSLRNDRDVQTFAAIEPAELIAQAPTGGASRTFIVHIIDQDDAEHVVKAGNHLNPKCLAWGRNGYRPVPGDSGAGVFYVPATSEGAQHPLLIGNVALADDRGGFAPLLGRNLAWIDDAIDHARPVPSR